MRGPSNGASVATKCRGAQGRRQRKTAEPGAVLQRAGAMHALRLPNTSQTSPSATATRQLAKEPVPLQASPTSHAGDVLRQVPPSAPDAMGHRSPTQLPTSHALAPVDEGLHVPPGVPAAMQR